MRIAVPRMATLRVRMLRTNGSTVIGPISVPAPAGVSYVRLFADSGPSGRGIIDVRGAVGGRALRVRFPVVIG